MRPPTLLAAATLILAVGLASRSDAARGGGIPSRPTVYEVVMTGSANGFSFERTGYFVIEPGVRATGGANFNNGRNQREVGLYSGSPPSSPETGAIWFATNTTVHYQVGVGNNLPGAAGIDTCYVSLNTNRRQVGVRVDEQVSRTNLLNCFNVLSGLTADVYQVTSGQLVVRFDRTGATVTGALSLGGTGYIYPGQARLEVNFSGRRVD